ncbi:MAG: DUF3794 domain-containing protein, partial [Oscillospiraceae bacterium]|nr:DUF3794 domain-containing protein [Oscillospiraceae bacterium]
MELKRICKEINCWDEVFSAQQKKQLSAHTIVPDTSPDALAAGDSCAVVLVKTKQVLQGRVEVSGTVVCLTAYTSGDDSSRRVETSLPFSTMFEDSRIESDDTVILKVRCERIDSEVINSRKIGLDVQLSIAID